MTRSSVVMPKFKLPVRMLLANSFGMQIVVLRHPTLELAARAHGYHQKMRRVDRGVDVAIARS